MAAKAIHHPLTMPHTRGRAESIRSSGIQRRCCGRSKANRDASASVDRSDPARRPRPQGLLTPVHRWPPPFRRCIFLRAGAHVVAWDPQALEAGVYLYRLEAGPFRQTRRLVLLR